MSTLLFALSTANREFPDALLVMASAVYEAPELELSATTIALLRFAPGDHALIVPSSESKIKNAVDPLTLNSEEPLNTRPVGDPTNALAAGGTATTSPCLTPGLLYSVDHPEPWFATHHGVVAPRASPHAFTINGSSNLACCNWLESRL